MSEYVLNEIAVSEEENGISVEALLRRRGISRRLLILLKRTENGITLNGRLMRSVDMVSAGDRLILRIPQPKGGAEPNPSLRVDVVYEDEDVAVFNKPCFMPVHESCGHRGDTLSNVFAARYPQIPFRAVNRLDRDTSGLCLVAKNRRSANIPSENIEKVYYAVCEGIIEDDMRIDLPIAREDGSSIKRQVCPWGKPAVTNIKPIRWGNGHTLLEIHLETGRTHQIRVHLSHIGHPLAGDDLYGGSREYIGRQALHCGRMRFRHPVSGIITEVYADIPDDIVRIL